MRDIFIKGYKFYNYVDLDCDFICGHVKADKFTAFLGYNTKLIDGSDIAYIVPDEDKYKDISEFRCLCCVDSEKFYRYFVPIIEGENIEEKAKYITSILDSIINNPNKDELLHYLYYNKIGIVKSIKEGADIMVDRHDIYFSNIEKLKEVKNIIENFNIVKEETKNE